LLLAACGGGGGSAGGGGSTPSFLIGGNVSGLISGRSLTLQDNGSNNTIVSDNGAFSFSTTVASGAAYAVTVLTQPPGQNCSVANGSGAANAGNVSNVSVVCVAKPYTIGGSVSGLAGTLVLQDNRGDNLSLSADGAFVFASPVAAGAAYGVTVLTQPHGQQCSVSAGSGTVGSANVADVALLCLAEVWSWVGGSSTTGAAGVYGTLGASSDITMPGARENASAWADTAGSLSVFGGQGYDAAGTLGDLNDLWTYCLCTGVRAWTWVSGSDRVNATGVYGTLGTAEAGNVPGARHGAGAWTDQYGNFWLFGGQGIDSAGTKDLLNDLWKFTPSIGTWAWVSGAKLAHAGGVYGSRGVSAASNMPGARSAASTWFDASGNLWLFGGQGLDANGTAGALNDLWVFSSSNGGWIWVSGSSLVDAAGVYGGLGTASAANAPGSRQAANAWIDPSGMLWLFGGQGRDAAGATGALNDLWKFNPADGTWMWVSGASQVNATGVYGTLGTASPGNAPGARQGANALIDASGTLWLFGGHGLDSAGTAGELSDLWKFNPAGASWTWVSGAKTVNAAGVYGTLGAVSASNSPGARSAGFTWADPAGKLWLFGGRGYGAAGSGLLNDMWEYTP
jgi:N-acetylneuraminic acid mutarotase